MKIMLNGEPREIAPATTVAGLLAELGLASERVAVERNREIIPRREHGRAALSEGDHVEVVQFVGGG